VLVLHDTTDLRRLERLRQEFVANVSHELKTPLTVIKMDVESLQNGAAEDPAHRGPFLERLARQADRLHLLILDLLSLARIESGNEVFDFQSIDVEPLVLACVERVRPRAESKHQTLQIGGESRIEDRSCSLPAAAPGSAAVDSGDPRSAIRDPRSSSPVTVWADEEAIDQILDNLLDNAIKYTPDHGRVSVGWRRAGDQVIIEVSDTGIGIPAADLPRIFERFYRVDKARSRVMGGTGLGLAIVKHLVGAMRGSIRADARIGQGSTFTITLPAGAE
jgi:two-component system phosphate regulon sensor histidine kinase PhoR